MSNVTLTIAGRRYTVACAAGEEAHIAQLGAMIEARLADQKTPAGQSLANQSEARVLLYAALLLADEAHDAVRSARSSEAEIGEKLELLADRLETLAQQLETGGKKA